MAEELTSAEAKETPSQEKPVEQAQPKTETPQSEQPKAEAQPQAPEPKAEKPQEKPVNLFELPEFKKFQAQQNKTISQLQQQLNAAQQAIHEARTSNMDEQERLQYEYGQLKTAYDQMMGEQQYQQQKQKDLAMLSEKFRVPIIKLWDAESYEEALERVATYQTEQAAARDAKRADKLERNTVDVGGGKPVTVEDERAKTMKSLAASGNTKDYIKLLLES